MAKRVTISHPDIEGEATIVASSLSVWEDKGWQVVPEGNNEQLVEEESQTAFSFDVDDLDDTVDEDEDVADE